MRTFALLILVALALAVAPSRAALERALVLESGAAVVSLNLHGGVISGLRLRGEALNPLEGMGHFLCLDRWGPPSAAEEKNGMPFHGEASRVEWRQTRAPGRRNGGVEAEMTAGLPLAGLSVRRELRLADDAPLLVVRETVTNRNRLGRIFNMVQHPTIGPPFLDAETLVDAGAGRGFMQSSPLPNPEKPEVRWPEALLKDRPVDLRRLTDNPDPNVVSFEALGPLGWTTACAPAQERLIGYVWKTADYPWFNAWRHVDKGKPALRGLEFGTTGLHQPFPILVAKGRIFDLPLYTYLDAGESVTRSYAAFLMRTPPGFRGVAAVAYRKGRLEVTERAAEGRRLSIPAENLW